MTELPISTSNRWTPPTPEHMQAMLPQYDEWSLLGYGGMGAVYKARQTSLDRAVAVKVLPPEAAADEVEFSERFKNEARTMAKMNHPAIVAVYDFGSTADGLLYIVMEYIDGTDVAKMVSSQGKLPPEHALAITAHVCDALAYAHEHGVIHRDIKPANILINMEGAVKVADFGLARMETPGQTSGLTRSGLAMGTPDYVAPETLAPDMVADGRADLYAVGVMLYNMLTGSIPRGFFELPSAKVGSDRRFDAIIRKAMEHDVANRYQSSREIRRDLDRILTVPEAQDKPKPQVRQAPPRTRAQATPPPPPPKSAPWGLIAAVLAIAGIAAYFFIKPAALEKKPEVVEKPKTELSKAETAPGPKKAEETPKPRPAVVLQTHPNAPKGSPLSELPVLSHVGHHYQLVSQEMNFANAQSHAESLGAHLATITSEDEMTWLGDILPQVLQSTRSINVTIGASRDEKGSWTWVTGEPFQYTHWKEAAEATMDLEKKLVLKLTSNGKDPVNWGNGHRDAGRSFLIEWEPAAAKSVPAPAVVVESESAKRLRELDTSFHAALERDVLVKHRTAVTDLNTKYAAALERALAAATAADALALREEKRRIESGEALPEEDAGDLAAALKPLRGTYRTSLKPIKTERHNGLINLFVKYEEVLKATKLDDAKLVSERLTELALERQEMLNEVLELIPDGKEIVLRDNQRFTSTEKYAPPVEFTIVAKTDSLNLRMAHAPKAVIFNWERNQDELRVDNDPGGARHVPGKGRIPANEFVTIHWRVMPNMQSIRVNGELRMIHFGDYSQVSKEIAVFPADTTVTLKSLKVRAGNVKTLEKHVSTTPEMRERLLDAKDWVGPLTIPAGSYKPLRRINIGTNLDKTGKNSDEKRGDVTSLPGVRMEGVRYHLLEGSWMADGGLFREVKFTADLGGSLEAKNSLFQDCTFSKEGGWYVAWFSSKWRFTNCVFKGSFMQNWKIGDVGMQLDGCTFQDVDFIPISYKEDAGKEANMDWLSMQNCHFVSCRVPESFALATKNCLFEKCTFGEPESKLPVQTPLKAVLHVQDCLNTPTAGPGRSFEVLPTTPQSGKVGASLPQVQGGLEFPRLLK